MCNNLSRRLLEISGKSIKIFVYRVLLIIVLGNSELRIWLMWGLF